MNRRKTKKMKSGILTPTKFKMQALGIFHRVIKSVWFNIFMILLGFSIGFCYTLITTHYNAVTNTHYSYITKIQKCIKDIDELNKNYDIVYIQKTDELKKIVKELNDKLAYESCDVYNVFRHNVKTNTVFTVIRDK